MSRNPFKEPNPFKRQITIDEGIIQLEYSEDSPEVRDPNIHRTDREPDEVLLSKLENWISDLASGVYGHTVKADAGWDNDLTQGLIILRKKLDEWYKKEGSEH